ncbi:MAG: YihY/virulence factor BrkB family protein [Halomonas sp.]|nr:YihY/virulence factor BrkB family protein [Halomonas sp.]
MSARKKAQERIVDIAPHLYRFALRVLVIFFYNRGILLAGGVGYSVLLSVVPLFAVLCVLLTHIVNEQQLLAIISIQARHLAPAHANIILDAVRALLDSRAVVGTVGTLVLLFFSSFAFRMLEDSISIIFHQPEDPARRRFWISALLPYAFIVMLGAGLLALALLIVLANAFNDMVIALFGIELHTAGMATALLNLFSFIGMFLLFSAIYKVMPVVRIGYLRAFIGGFVAALLWEGVRVLLIYYFANLSLVNAVYGSLATIVVVLLSLEIGSIILLLGAQVIAELERSARAGVPWHTEPGKRYR